MYMQGEHAMKSSKAFTGQKHPQRKSFGPLLVGLFIIGGLAVIAIPLYLGYSSMMGGSTPQTAQQFALATPGSQVTVVVEVTDTPSQTQLTGNLLNKNGDGTYSRTGQTVTVKWDPSGSVSMGSSSDVKVGAILQVVGQVDANDVLTASQLVILTDVVQLK
jgi:hypothetical protein